MKVALIPPIPDLERFIDDRCTHHLVLAHLLAPESPMHEEYGAFFRGRADRGDFITLDNGAKELGKGLHVATSLDMARRIGAREVVLPDALLDDKDTIVLGIESLDWLRDEWDRNEPLPRIMIVPQGQTMSAWSSCLQQLLWATIATLQALDQPDKITIGVAYRYNDIILGGITRLLGHLFNSLNFTYDFEVHLLGCPRDLRSLGIASRCFPQIRSVDTSRPFVYGKHGRIADHLSRYPGRDEAYFTESIAERHTTITRRNIRIMRSLALDVEVVA